MVSSVFCTDVTKPKSRRSNMSVFRKRGSSSQMRICFGFVPECVFLVPILRSINQLGRDSEYRSVGFFPQDVGIPRDGCGARLFERGDFKSNFRLLSISHVHRLRFGIFGPFLALLRSKDAQKMISNGGVEK